MMAHGAGVDARFSSGLPYHKVKMVSGVNSSVAWSVPCFPSAEV